MQRVNNEINSIRRLIVNEIRQLLGNDSVAAVARRRVVVEVTYRGGGIFLDVPIKIVLHSVMGTLMILGYNPTKGEVLVGIDDDYDSVPVADLENDIDFESMSEQDIAALAAVEDRIGIEVPDPEADMMPGSRLVPEGIRQRLGSARTRVVEALQPVAGPGEIMSHVDDWIDVGPGDELDIDGVHVVVHHYDVVSTKLTYSPVIDDVGTLGKQQTLFAYDAIDEMGGGQPRHTVTLISRSQL